MSDRYILAIDAGTGSVRAVLFDLAGNEIGCVQQEWEHREDKRYPGSMDFDWNLNWELACSCIRSVMGQSSVEPRDIAAISTTCMREGIVLYNEAGEELWACANVDARSTEEVKRLIETYPGLETELYRQSGQSYALDALPRLLWVRDKMPEVYEKIARIGMFNDWLIYKMTGVLAVEPSNGSTTGLFDLQKRTWDPSIAERCGLRTDIFPEVRECGERAGSTTKECEEQTGLVQGTPVIVGGGDAQLGCIGVGAVKPGQAAVFGGSFWQYEYNSMDGSTDEQCRIRVNCHAVPGVWQYEALAFKPGLVMRWFRDGFCQAEKETAKHKGIDPYEEINRHAANVPAGCYGMMCVFSDVMNFLSWKHASPTFTNFELDSGRFSKYTFYRAILENTAMVTKGHVDLVREATGRQPEEIIFAGGASKSPLWCQILSDVLGLPVKVPIVKEATALGAAILAGYGIGIYKDLSRASQELVKWDKTYVPDKNNHQLYLKLFEQWRKIYKAQLDICNQSLTRSMWTAPGL